MSWRPSRRVALAALLALACGRGSGPGSLAELAPPAEPDRPESWTRYYAAMAVLGEGFVVWESLRAGHWRIWIRGLDGSPERQLSPDEPGRDHVAAHVAPDGRHVLYLSLPAPHRDFEQLAPGMSAPLHLASLEGRALVGDRVVAPDARTYDGSRVALWVDARRFIYIAGDNTTRQLDIVTGAEEVLIPEPRTNYGLLVNATRTHATNGTPTFSIYHPSDRTVSRRARLAGCEPYFTPDGRLGYWVADVGGPIRKIDLVDYGTEIVLERDSKWLPPGRGYVYYPMASADGRLLAFAASKDEHGHFDKDFDVFVAPLDERFQVSGAAVRYSFSSGPDRFPDVWIAGSELGRHRGEAPFHVAFAPDPGSAEPGPWSFEYGDGARGGDPVHVYDRPGTYRVQATRGSRRLGGEVAVTFASPPRLVRVEVLPGARELEAVFDEPIDAGRASARLAAGARVTAVRVGESGRDLVVSLAEPLGAPDVLVVEDVADRAGTPNLLDSAQAPVAVAGWPGVGDGLVFAFGTDDRSPPVRDVDTGHERTFSLTPRGRARYDAHGALVVSGGWFEADELPKGLAAAFRKSAELTLEVTVWPKRRRTEDPARILSFSHDARSQNLSLSQDGSDAVLRIRVTSDGEKRQEDVEFGQLAAGLPTHLLVSYRPGRLVAYQDGALALDTDAVSGDFSDWRDDVRLALGADPGDGARDFEGRIEGVALYTRFFEAEEAAAHANAYLHDVAERKPVPRVRMKARLLASSAPPTLEQIAPYREALAVSEYEVPAARRGKLGAERVRVAHWAILDGAVQPAREPSAEALVALELEPWDAHPRLESSYLADSLDPAPDVPLYVDVGD